MTGRVRFDRALSKLGVASRSDARRLITGGDVLLDGRVETNPATLIDPERSRIVVGGRRARAARWRTIAFHKPRGVVTARRDPDNRETVFDLLGEEAGSLVAVGRLDLASSGLLLLTSDTRLANWLTDPSSAVVRRYAVTARGRLSAEAALQMERGIAGLQAKSVHIRKASGRETHLIVELTEGRNREIRRLLHAVGSEATKLLRVAYGGIQLGTLQPGEWREITPDEIASAFPSWRSARGRPGR